MSGAELVPVGAPNDSQSEGVVKQLSAGEFLQLASAPFSIIQVGDGVKPSGFSAAIQLLLGLFHPVPIRFGVLDLGVIDWGRFVLYLIRPSLESLGLQPDFLGRPPAGYYLFAEGVPLAFHPGRADLEKDGNALGMAALASIAALALKSPELAKLVPHIGEWNAGERAAKAFELAIQAHRQGRR